MNFKECEIKGIVLIKPKLIYDERGFFSEVYRKKILNDIVGDKINFCQSNISESSYGTIRGLHFQISPNAQSKLVSVQKGEVLMLFLILEKTHLAMVNFIQ